MFNGMDRVSDSLSYGISWPAFDVKEDNETYTLEAAVPSIDQRDVIVEFSDDQNLIIRGWTEHSRLEGQRPGIVTGFGEIGTSTSDSKEVAASGSSSAAWTTTWHTYWVSERTVGGFARGFTFPTRVNQDKVKGSLRSGILSVGSSQAYSMQSTRQ